MPVSSSRSLHAQRCHQPGDLERRERAHRGQTNADSGADELVHHLRGVAVDPRGEHTAQETFNFTANSASSTLTFASVDTGCDHCAWGPVIDNVSVSAETSSVPEPASSTMFSIACVGLALFRRMPGKTR
jgi:hypothetical protein